MKLNGSVFTARAAAFTYRLMTANRYIDSNDSNRGKDGGSWRFLVCRVVSSERDYGVYYFSKTKPGIVILFAVEGQPLGGSFSGSASTQAEWHRAGFGYRYGYRLPP